MEQQNKPFIHDTINLDEIRMLLDGDIDCSLTLDDEIVENSKAVELPVESLENEVEAADHAVEGSGVEDADDGIDLPSFMMEDAPEASASEDAEVTETSEKEEVVSEDEMADGSEEIVNEDSEEEATGKTEKKKGSAAFELYAMLHDVIYLLAAVTLIFVFIVRLVGVKGDSMLPTLHNRDYLILESNFLYNGEDLKYGDVVVLNVPSDEMKDEGPIVKRVIATEGQEVNIDFETGAVYVNGVLLHETYINTPTNYNWDGEYGLEYPAVVPENCIFVLGDNRNNSLDSRYAPIGMVDERCVLGKVLLIALPGQTVDQAGNVVDPRDWGRIGLVS